MKKLLEAAKRTEKAADIFRLLMAVSVVVMDGESFLPSQEEEFEYDPEDKSLLKEAEEYLNKMLLELVLREGFSLSNWKRRFDADKDNEELQEEISKVLKVVKYVGWKQRGFLTPEFDEMKCRIQAAFEWAHVD